MHYIKKILLVLQKVLHNTAPLNGLLSLKRAYSRRDLLLWFAGHAIKCYQCRSPKCWDDCVPGNDTTCASPLNSCVKVKLQTRRWKGWQKRELFRQSMCWKKELQQGRRLQACRTASGYEVQRLRFQLLRDRPVQWSQSTDGQQLLVLGMRSSS